MMYLPAAAAVLAAAINSSGGLRNLGDAELLELSLVVEVNQRAGVLRQAVSLAANLNQAVRAGCEVVLVLLGILGHILQQTLGEDLRAARRNRPEPDPEPRRT